MFLRKNSIALVPMVFFVIVGSSLPALQDGLIGYWPMDEETGTNVTDCCGLGNDGTIEGTVDRHVGKFGNCLYFNTNSDRVVIQHAGQYNVSDNEITVSCYVKTSLTMSDWEGFVTKNPASSYTGWSLGSDSNGIRPAGISRLHRI